MSVTRPSRVTATGDVTTASVHLHGVVLTAGADAASVTVRMGGSGGTIILTVKALAGTTVEVPVPRVPCADGVHATLTGTSPEASLFYE